jgi:hypothetical protein
VLAALALSRLFGVFLALALRPFAVALRLIAVPLLVLRILLPLARLSALTLFPILILIPLIVSHGLSSGLLGPRRS